MNLPSVSRRRGLALCSAALALSAPFASAQDKKAPPKPADDGYSGGAVIVIEHASLDKLFSDPKDKRFGEAVAMVPLRLKELPSELPDAQIPPEAIDIAQALLKDAVRPGRLTVAYDESPTGGFFGYGVAFSVLTPEKAEADRMQSQVSGLIDMADNFPRSKPSSRYKGMFDIETPAGLVTYGPRQAKDGWRYELIVGTMQDADIGAAALPTPPKGLDVLARGRIDLSGLTPGADTLQAFAAREPEAREIVREVRTYLVDLGLLGSKALKMSFLSGRTETESVSLATVENAGRVADYLGVSRQPLDRSILAMIPADSGHASVSRMGYAWVNKLIDKVKDKSDDVARAVNQFKAMTGVDFQDEVIASLGDVSGYYTSESTGGGGIGSSVVMISLKDREKFSGAVTKLSQFINAMGREHARGYVRVTPGANRDGVAWYSLQFPGVPVPLELSMAMTDKWLLVAPTPQALTVALNQARGKGDAGLQSNPVFASAFPKDAPFAAVSFTDTTKTLGEGYTFLTMVGSAVTNMVRSPSDPARDPGMIVPLFNDLKKGARPTIGWGTWQGESYVYESHSDHSLLVNAATGLASMARGLPLMAVQMMGAMNNVRGVRGGMAPAIPQRIRHAEPGVISDAGEAVSWLYREMLPEFNPERMVMTTGRE
jgi:hypothetical protein